jgi:hypothetical protein
MLRAKLETANLSKEMDSEVEDWLIALDKEVDLTGWQIFVYSHPLEPRIDATVTAPDGTKHRGTVGPRIETPLEVRDFVAVEYERWQDRNAPKDSN